MKIGILTFPNSTSYGAVLQMYALVQTVKGLNGDVEIINYHNSHMKAERHIRKLRKGGAGGRWLGRALRRLLHCRQYGEFRAFERGMPLYPSSPFADKERLREVGERYDAVICGSDQVWNPEITDSDMSYFLDFCGPHTRRISYAPSFGITDFPEAFRDAVSKELGKFSHLSVREAQGQAWIRRLLHREVPLVVDPTLLLTEREWARAEREYPGAWGDYILYYVIQRSDRLFRFCMELAEKCGMKVLLVGGNGVQKWLNRDERLEYACDVAPQEWLYLVHHARCVVTNSFHGTAFAINYRKDFYVEFSSPANARLEHIIHAFGLEKQIVKGEGISQIAPTDYTQADRRLPAMRRESMEFLKAAISPPAQEKSVYTPFPGAAVRSVHERDKNI